VDHKLVLELVVGVAVEEVEEVVVGEAVEVVHKLVLEVSVAAVGEVVVQVDHKQVLEVVAGDVAALAVDRTVLQGLLEPVQEHRCLQPVPGNRLVHPTRESSAPQTLVPREARGQRT
jgi:hypothetical protein